MKIKAVLFGVIIFLLVQNIGFVFADESLTVNLTINTSEVWLREVETQKYPNPKIEISADCYSNGTKVTENATWVISLYDGSYKLKKSYDGPSTSFILENGWSYGDYIIEAICEYNGKTNETNKTLKVHKLELSLEENSVEAYIGDELEIPIDFKVDGSAKEYIRAKYELRIGSEYIDIDKANDLELDETTLYIKAPIDLSFSEGYKSLKLEINYASQELEINKNNFIYLKSPLNIDTTASSVTCMANDICEFDLDVKVYYYGIGSIEDFDENNFVIGVFDDGDIVEYADISEITCDSDTKSCKLSLLVPELEPGDYILSVKAVRLEYESTNTLPLTSVLSLSGEIVDASGKDVPVSMTFKNNENGKISKIDSSSGYYSLNIVPGEYTFHTDFGSGTLLVDIFNVTFEPDVVEYGNNINFDSFVGTSPIKGVHVTKVVVLEFGYDFKEALLKIPYDGSNVNVEENLRVYRCDKWNFDKRICCGGWELVDSKIYPIPNLVEVKTEEFGAFVLGEQKYLHFNVAGVSSNRNTIYLGDTVPVEGQLLDSDGEEIEGAKITLKVEDYTSNTTTLSDGSFLGYVKLPYEEGTFELEISAIKKPFISVTEKQVVKTTKRKDISLLLPTSSVNVNLDTTQVIDFSVVNNGQVNLTDIYFLIDGLSINNYNIAPTRINILEPGEQKEIKMNVDISSDNCGEKCNQYYLVGIEVKAKTETSEEISGGGSFTIELKKPVETESSETFLSKISGRFSLSLNSKTNLISGILIIIIIILIILIMLKKKNKLLYFSGRNYSFRRAAPYFRKSVTNMPRNGVVSSIHSIKSQIRDKK